VEALGEVSSNGCQYCPTAKRLSHFFASCLKRKQTTSFKTLGELEKLTKKYISVVSKTFKDVNLMVIINLGKTNSAIISF
jgi:hypothetical protein